MNQNPFLEALQSFQHDFTNVSKKEDLLIVKKEILKKGLETTFSTNSTALNQDSILVNIIDELLLSIKSCFHQWEVDFENSLPMKKLSELYDDRVIFLVFGKVNAGKSSFSNFIAEFFQKDQVKHFRFNEGEIEYFDGCFAEGVTETTTTIQGVELGRNLVLLDSPGLHSVNDKNGDLTRRFTDSADAVLWLTPSTSPGQVQELNDLKNELEKKKPLLPIITRSDVLVEDYCEQTQDIVQILKNKNDQNRQLQQNDVINRLKGYNGIDSDMLKQAISISVHAYKKSNQQERDFNESGLYNLFSCLGFIIEEAKFYKIRKAEQQMLNFLDEKVLSSLLNNINPIITKLSKETENTLNSLNKKKQKLALIITADVISEVTDIVNKYKKSCDKNAISSEINELIENKLNKALQEELSQFVAELKRTTSTLSTNSLGDFEAITIDIERIKGRVTKSITTLAGGAGGAASGAALGSMIMPGVGTIIGGLLGGLLGSGAGSAVGNYFVETEVVTENVGVSTERIIKDTTDSIKSLLPNMIETTFNDVIKMILPVKVLCADLDLVIQKFAVDITALKR